MEQNKNYSGSFQPYGLSCKFEDKTFLLKNKVCTKLNF